MAEPTKGWVSLHRQIKENWIWQEDEPYDKRSAWVDLLLMANFEDRKIKLPRENKLLELKRGQFLTSEVKLAEKWHWSVTKVRNFLQLLELDGMIINTKNDCRGTVLTISNYEDFQNPEKSENKAEEIQEENEKNSEEKQEKNEKIQLNNNNNINNKNKENNLNNPPPCKISENSNAEVAEEKIKFLSLLKNTANYPFKKDDDSRLYDFLKENHPEINIISRVFEWLEINRFDLKQKTRRRICEFFKVKSPEAQQNLDTEEKTRKRFEGDNHLTNKELAKMRLNDIPYGVKLNDNQKRMLAEIQYVHNFSPQDFWILQEIEDNPEYKKAFDSLIKQVEKEFKPIGVNRNG